MSILTCNACNVTFSDESSQRDHYRCDWHRYNLKRKVAQLPGVTSAWFDKRREAISAERNKDAERMVYVCQMCGRQYFSKHAHAQHLQSKAHLAKLAASSNSQDGQPISVVRPAPSRDSHSRNGRGEAPSAQSQTLPKLTGGDGEDDNDDDDEDENDGEREGSDDGSGEWTVVDNELEAAEALAQMSVNDSGAVSSSHGENGKVRHKKDGAEQVKKDGEEDEEDTWEPSTCLFCDRTHQGNVEECVEHMHRVHGFFVPDAEYLKDLTGLLEYLYLKITKCFMCLFCDGKGKLLHSKEAARDHMISKNHCKLRFGEMEDGDEELEEFYDYSSSYEDGGAEGRMILAGDAVEAPVELMSGGMELKLRGTPGDGSTSKVIGSRQMMRFYRQRPRPSENREIILVNKLIARYRSLGLATRQTDRVHGRMDPLSMASRRAEAAQLKLNLKSNVIRNLPRNCTY